MNHLKVLRTRIKLRWYWLTFDSEMNSLSPKILLSVFIHCKCANSGFQTFITVQIHTSLTSFKYHSIYLSNKSVIYTSLKHYFVCSLGMFLRSLAHDHTLQTSFTSSLLSAFWGFLPTQNDTFIGLHSLRTCCSELAGSKAGTSVCTWTSSNWQLS